MSHRFRRWTQIRNQNKRQDAQFSQLLNFDPRVSLKSVAESDFFHGSKVGGIVIP
jgi:hypothetical protein